MDAVTGGGSKNSGQGTSIADLRATSLDGQQVALGDYVGQKVILDFWATWCGPCRKQRAVFAGMDEEFLADVQIVSLSVGESAQTVSDFLAHESVEVPALDLLAPNEIAQLFGVQSIPMLVFVDSTGNVQETRTGVQSAGVLKRIVQSMP